MPDEPHPNRPPAAGRPEGTSCSRLPDDTTATRKPRTARPDPGHGGSRRACVRDRPGRTLSLGEPGVRRALRRPARPAVRGQRGAGAQAGLAHELRSQDGREDHDDLRHDRARSRRRAADVADQLGAAAGGRRSDRRPGDRHAAGADDDPNALGARRPDAASAGGAAAAGRGARDAGDRAASRRGRRDRPQPHPRAPACDRRPFPAGGGAAGLPARGGRPHADPAGSGGRATRRADPGRGHVFGSTCRRLPTTPVRIAAR